MTKSTHAHTNTHTNTHTRVCVGSASPETGEANTTTLINPEEAHAARLGVSVHEDNAKENEGAGSTAIKVFKASRAPINNPEGAATGE